MKEEDLVRKAVGGDREAFGEIVRLFGERIWRLGLKLTGDETAAEEIAQETFVKALSSIGSFRGEAAIGTWLYRIATNTAFSRGRRRRRFEPDELDDSLPARGPGPEEELEAGLIRERIREEVSALPAREREVFVMREFEHLPHAEIAGSLGIAESTSKVHYFNAIRRLRKGLEDLV